MSELGKSDVEESNEKGVKSSMGRKRAFSTFSQAPEEPEMIDLDIKSQAVPKQKLLMKKDQLIEQLSDAQLQPPALKRQRKELT